MALFKGLPDTKSNRRHDGQPKNGTGTMAALFVAGTAVGTVAGMLAAPRSGKETRDKLRDTGRAGINRSKGVMNRKKETAATADRQMEDSAKEIAGKDESQAGDSTGRTDQAPR